MTSLSQGHKTVALKRYSAISTRADVGYAFPSYSETLACFITLPGFEGGHVNAISL